MAEVIQHKRSSTTGAVPVAGDLSLGELAINTADGKLFLKKSNGDVVEIGNGSTSLTWEVDGGRADSIYTAEQALSGGSASG